MNLTPEQIFDKQKAYFNSNATKSVTFRKEQLKRLYHVLKQNEEQLFEAIYTDFKKSRFDAYTTELGILYHDINEFVGHLSKWAKPKRVGTNLINFPAKSYIIPEPFGVSLVIGAWNYPYQLSLAPAIAAIAAGNTVMLKPSELPANTSKALHKIISENFDPAFFAVIEGGVPETSALLELPFDKIFFTGSVPVGRIVYQAAAKNLTPVTLELGGKSPAFILPDANLNMTVKRLVWAKFINAGQTCIAPDYVLVHESIKPQFIEAVKAQIERSNFSTDNGNYVQIINKRNFERLLGYIDASKVVYGGQADAAERTISPTIMDHVTLEDNVMKDEIFGPILPVLTYKNLDEAIALVKNLPKPLSAYIFTSSKIARRKILHEISFGGGAVNDAIMHISNPKLPFGGVGPSGIGSYHGYEGFRAFSHYKSILDKATWFESSLKYPPLTETKLKLARWAFEKL